MSPTFELPSATITSHEICVNRMAVLSQPRIQLVLVVFLNKGSVMPLIGRDAKGANRQDVWQQIFVQQFYECVPFRIRDE